MICPRSRTVLETIAPVLAAALLIVSCGSADDGGTAGTIDGELFDFSLVQDSEFTFDADPTDPTRGIFRMRTTEPMICTIVWGETEEFGNFNNSLAMNGTGITDHDVFLPGAEPGREYRFRVQGSTADGRQFRSETGTFVIPETTGDGGSGGDAPPDGDTTSLGANLALEATVVGASSEFGPGWEAENALDDDPLTEWATAGDGDGGFLVIDLGAPREVAGVEFLTRSMADGTAVTQTYTLTVDDGEPLGPFPAGTLAVPNFSDVEFSGRLVRFDVEVSTGGNVGAVEVRVVAPPEG